MGTYTVISKVSGRIQELLRQLLVPELVVDREGVSVCSPSDRGEASVGIFLYDIQEYEGVRANRMQDIGVGRQQYPPMYLDLYYMLTAYSASDRRYRMSQEEQILGRVLQYFYDYPALSQEDPAMRIQFQNVSTEDKFKLWNFPNEEYRVSLFYKVSPVVLESVRTREVSRVKEVSIGGLSGAGSAADDRGIISEHPRR